MSVTFYSVRRIRKQTQLPHHHAAPRRMKISASGSEVHPTKPKIKQDLHEEQNGKLERGQQLFQG